MPDDWRDAVVDEDTGLVERIPYELCVLVALRKAIRRREIWVEGGNASAPWSTRPWTPATPRCGGPGTACASDSRKFGSWSANFMTEWHQRYGGAGIMVYWHVERKNVCIYSQVRSTTDSEVASMIEGLLRHLTSAEIDRQYTDTHGASIVGFAFSHLLDFKLLPRLKNIGSGTPVPAWPDRGRGMA